MLSYVSIGYWLKRNVLQRVDDYAGTTHAYLRKSISSQAKQTLNLWKTIHLYHYNQYHTRFLSSYLLISLKNTGFVFTIQCLLRMCVIKALYKILFFLSLSNLCQLTIYPTRSCIIHLHKLVGQVNRCFSLTFITSSESQILQTHFPHYMTRIFNRGFFKFLIRLYMSIFL